MENLRSKYNGLVREFRAKEKLLIELRTSQKVVESSKKKVETQLVGFLKLKTFSAKEVEIGLDRLDKELNTRIDSLAESLTEYESILSEVKSGGESLETPPDMPSEELSPIDSLLKEDD